VSYTPNKRELAAFKLIAEGMAGFYFDHYAELESEKPEARPDPTVNTDGKPKVIKKRPTGKAKAIKRKSRRGARTK
jgi:hypothetical protein